MAQADYDLAAQISGFNLRTELNSIFEAVLTNNSGSTEPESTKPFMFWLDTSNINYYYLKMRNHDNTSWATFAVYIVATKELSAVDTSKVAKVTSTDNAIVRFNGTTGEVQNSGVIIDDSNNMWLQGNGNLLLGTTTDSGVDKLQVNGSVNTTGDLTVGSGFAYGGGISFRANFAPSSNIGIYAKEFNGVHYDGLGIAAYSGLSVYTGAAMPERLRLTSGGNLLLGTTTDSGVDKLQVNGSISIRPSVSATPTNNGDLTFEATSNTTVKIKLKGSDGVVRSATLTLS